MGEPASRLVEAPGSGSALPLKDALEALERFPALGPSRDRLIEALARRARIADVAELVETDVALLGAVLRAANRGERRRIGSARDALRVIERDELEQIVETVPVFRFFQGGGQAELAPERFCVHSVAVQRLASRLVTETRHVRRDPLLAAALLHDLGKLVLALANPGYPEAFWGEVRVPEARVRIERNELGLDHARVGAELVRAWGLPESLAVAIERHHAPDATGEAAVIRLADMLALYQSGRPVAPTQILEASLAVGLGRDALGRLMYDLPAPVAETGPDAPSPLTAREAEVLQLLSHGKVYKQIALELGMSASTARNHLHNAYGKLGAVDRAQAVLLATERGWI